MATNSTNATIVGQIYSFLSNISNKEYNTTDAAYAGRNELDQYYAYVLKFTTPEFQGVSQNIDVAIWMYNNLNDTTVTLRYALCTSDANKTSYVNTSEIVSDTNQIATGTVTFDELALSLDALAIAKKSQTFSIETEKVESNKTYYLFLWAFDSEDTGVEIISATSDYYGGHSVSIGYNSGIIYIDNGSSFDAYQCYIDNGSSWDLCIPYIDNGSNWDICG